MRIPFKQNLALLITYLKPIWLLVVLMAFFLLLNIGLQLLNPQILKNFIDGATQGASPTSLLLLALFFVAVALFNQCTNVIAQYLSTKVAWSATNRMRYDLLLHCLSLDMSYHQVHTSGEMIERIDGDVDLLSNFFSSFVVSLLSHIILLTGILILFFTISWYLGLAMTAFVVVTFLTLTLLRRRSIPMMIQMREMSASFFGFLGERLEGTEDIRANGATAAILRHFLLLSRRWFPIFRKAITRANLLSVGSLALFAAGTVLALALGTYLWSVNVISLGTVYILFSYTNQLSYPLQQVQSQLQDFQQAEASLRRVRELLAIQSALHEDASHTLPAGPLSITFNHVNFGYSADKPVLHDLTFLVPANKVLGLLGRTGSGKTTIARLLFRLYDPKQGEIRIADVPINQMMLRELRHCVGMVTQEVQIFHASVRDNLTFFNYTISDAQILEALEGVGLTPWYHSLADGLDTMLNGNNIGLSAGEAQLLAFTRVFLSNARVVILDEASSRLDSATEHLIEHAIEKLIAERTVIIIAHRLKTIQRADDILLLEDGQIVEYGHRLQLASEPSSRFSALLKIGLEEVLA